MRKVKRSECAVLRLVLSKKWYDMIASGEKTVEYRLAKPYWVKRISDWQLTPAKWRHVIAFSLGYRKPDMFFTCQDLFRYEQAFRPSLGEPNTDHFALFLGERFVMED